jgi:hypothetical protein
LVDTIDLVLPEVEVDLLKLVSPGVDVGEVVCRIIHERLFLNTSRESIALPAT